MRAVRGAAAASGKAAARATRVAPVRRGAAPSRRGRSAFRPLGALSDQAPKSFDAASATENFEKPTVLVAEKLGEAGIELLQKFSNVELAYGMDEHELLSKISLCDALIVRSGTQVTKEVFAASKGRLRVVGRAGVGIDNVDLHAATQPSHMAS